MIYNRYIYLFYSIGKKAAAAEERIFNRFGAAILRGTKSGVLINGMGGGGGTVPEEEDDDTVEWTKGFGTVVIVVAVVVMCSSSWSGGSEDEIRTCCGGGGCSAGGRKWNRTMLGDINGAGCRCCRHGGIIIIVRVVVVQFS